MKSVILALHEWQSELVTSRGKTIVERCSIILHHSKAAHTTVYLAILLCSDCKFKLLLNLITRNEPTKVDHVLRERQPHFLLRRSKCAIICESSVSSILGK
jgi:hypothetical protein